MCVCGKGLHGHRIFQFFREITWSAIAGSYGLFNFVRNCQIVFQSGNESSCYSISSSAFDAVSGLNVAHSNRRAVVSQCCVSLHFPNDIKC